MTATTTAPNTRRPHTGVPYLPGLDGMRALAVAVVMVYHANASWLPGGFLGVEVFFVLSGYLITLLLIGEHERTGRVALGTFWARRARRLLPALFMLLAGISLYTAVFRRDALGQLRGDIVAALGYVSNWYQIWVGQGYTATGDFAPLRHLWSLAVEEQFYVLWPLVMVVLLHVGRQRLPNISWVLLGLAVAITAVVALLFHGGPVGTPDVTPEAYWHVGERSISKLDLLYLSSPTRATGLLLGAAFAMVWRPAALLRGPMRRRAAVLDAVAVVGLVGLGALTWYLHIVTPAGADPWLFRGGFLVTGFATLCVIAAVTHRRSAMGWLLGNPLFVWLGTRSYGLYLYHWPIYQAMRRVAGNSLSVPQFVAGSAAAIVLAELSYRLVELPIRQRVVRRTWRRVQRTPSVTARRALAAAVALVIGSVGFAGVSLATARLEPNEIAAAQDEAARFVGNPLEMTAARTRRPTPTTTTTSTTSTTSTTTTTSTTAPATTTTTPASTTTRVPRTTVTAAAPPTTVAATTTTTSAPPPPPGDPCLATPIPRYALGDSVLLGAAAELSAAGFCVDAIVSRAFVNGLHQVLTLHAGARIGPVVVVALGTNGPIAEADLAQMMDALAGVPTVVVVTTFANRGYVPANNDKLRALPAAHPNVRIVDWANVAPTCPGRCFYDDGIHLRPDGRVFYAQQITAVTG